MPNPPAVFIFAHQSFTSVKPSHRNNFFENVTIRKMYALNEILIFLGTTESSKESTSSTWAMDGAGKPLCVSALSQMIHFSYVLFKT